MKDTSIEEGEINIPYFFLETDLENVDCNYFIQKIEEGIRYENNKSFVTNVKGEMTDWKYFKSDKIFLNMLFPVLDYIEHHLDLTRYELSNCWGLKEGWGHYTSLHHHDPCYFSGALYLNDHDSELNFPQLKKTIPTKKNKLLLFSSRLEHGTKRNIIKEPKYALAFNFDYAANQRY